MKPEAPTVEEEGSESLTTILANAETAAAQVEHATQQLERAAGSDPAPFVYDTETTEVARTFLNQIDRLTRLIAEDDAEIAFVEKDRDRQMHELQMRFESEQEDILNNSRQALSIVNARRADRNNARGAVQKTVDELKATKP